MVKNFLSMVALIAGLLGICFAAGYRNLPLDRELVESDAMIVDIRTESEWRQTGVVPGSLLLTFFKADGSYDLDSFVTELQRHIEPGQEVALLCRSGNRSARASNLLMEQGFPSVINVVGGIRTALKHGIELVPGEGKRQSSSAIGGSSR